MLRLPGLAQWGGRGFWAILDQGAFAASNFLLNILLARWLTPQEYGAFAVTFSAFLFLAALHFSLLIEPMLIFGAGRHRTVFRRYLQVLLAGHGAVSIAMAAVLGGVGLVAWRLDEGALAGSFLALALAGPFILFQWLMRRSCCARLNPRPSALAGVGYLVAVVGGAIVLFRADQLTAVLAIALMGVASLAAGAFTALTHRGVDEEAPAAGFARSVLREHWRYAAGPSRPMCSCWPRPTF